MTERHFTDVNGETLIVRHRRSAVLFYRHADLSLTNRFDRPSEPYVAHSELRRAFTFDDATFHELFAHLETAARAAWKDFTPKEADSFGADYAEYYDKPFDNNGYIRLRPNVLDIEAPNQPKSDDPLIRMFQLNKRKCEALVYDYRQL